MIHLALRLGGEPQRNGTWWPATYQDGARGAFWSCPKCGAAAGLKTHKINEEGLVHPSVICEGRPSKPCDFHDYIALSDIHPDVVNDHWGKT